MKGMKGLVILAILALFGLSWYTMIDGSVKEQAEYENNLTLARKNAEMGITSDAAQYYKKAFAMHGTLELRCEMAEFYRKAGLISDFKDWCEKLIKDCPMEEAGYLYLADYYQDENNIKECYDIIFKAKKRKLVSPALEEVDSALAYTYEVGWGSVPGTGEFFSGFCPVYNQENMWGFVDESGSQNVSYMYRSVQNFMPSGYAAVQNFDGEFFLIDQEGNRKFVDVEKKNIEECGPLYEDKMAAKIDGKYCYLDQEFHVLFGDYDYAGTFNGGLAAVKNQDRWSLVNADGTAAGEETWDDIKLDGLGMAVRKGILFVKKDGGYTMRNQEGQQIGEKQWEDVKHFSNDDWTCVKENGKWGYIDMEGNCVIQPEYEDAAPFSNGLAAVKVNGGWGYINKENKLVIPAEFEGARQFTASATTFIQENGVWKFLKLYRGSIKV